jgi:putative ABC transport system permease protein
MKDFIKRNINRGGLYYQDLPLQALMDIYMKETQRTFENGTRGSLSNVYILSMIALFVLVVACLNYVNLATARASSRMKEVGIRKVLGALKGSLVTQFLLESMIVCITATIVGVVLALLTLPLFNTLLATELSFSAAKSKCDGKTWYPRSRLKRFFRSLSRDGCIGLSTARHFPTIVNRPF